MTRSQSILSAAGQVKDAADGCDEANATPIVTIGRFMTGAVVTTRNAHGP